MNRNELVEFLRDPSSLSSENLEELEKIAAEAPYFQSVRMLLAKGSRMLNDPSAKKRIATAAIYATDRPLLKKYISGKLLFLTNPPEQKNKAGKTEEVETTPDSNEEKQESVSRHRPPREKYEFPKPKESKEPEPEPDDLEGKIVIPGIPEGALDGILEELEQDMEDLKSSRLKFADLQQQIEEEDAVSAALEKATSIEPPSEETPEEVTEAVPEKAPNIIQNLDEAEEEDEEVELHEPPEEEDFQKHGIISNFSDDDEFEDEAEDLVIADFKASPDEDEEAPSEKIETSSEVSPPKKETSSAKEEETQAEVPEILDQKVTEEVEPEETKAIEAVEEDTSEQLDTKDQEDVKEVNSDKEIAKADTKEAELEADDSGDSAPPVRLESEIKREERRERRANREKRLSSLNTLSESSLKKLEDQMWGDSDDEPADEVKKEAVKAPPAAEEKKAAIKKEPAKKPTKEKEAAPKKVAKSSTKSTSAKKKASAAKTAEKKAPKASIKKAATTKKSSTVKGTSKAKKTATGKKKDEDDGKAHPARDQDQIIEKFIKESPSISKPSLGDKRDKDLSDQSSSWNKELASEYLAEIYLQQGNKKRAIEIYQTLSLNFPDKKTYFADLISKIK